jgi:uncharacterized protein (TIGR02231 family)
MHRSIALALLFAAVAPERAAAADLTASSKVDAVTVYRGWARVTRLARVEVAPGETRVLLRGLPAGLDDDSLRVEGKGTARARVGGVSVERITRAELDLPEVRAAEVRVEALQGEDRALEDRQAAAKARGRFAESLRASYSEERSKNLAVRGVSAREWAELMAFVEGQLEAAAADGRRAEAGRRELARRLGAARAELEKLQAKRSGTSAEVAVELSAERGGALELAVSYLVQNAGWRPVWDARLDPESGAVELALLGEVSQRTGEDWTEARLALSTAEPGRGLTVPELEPRWLERARPAPMARGAMRADSPVSVAAAPPPLERRKALAEVKSEQVVELELEPEQAEASMGLLAATWTTPRRETVDGAGRSRTVPLARHALKGTVTRTVSPRGDPTAFLTATLVNDTGLPFLPGQARISLGEEFVGRAPLAATPPGGELKLAFGADPRLEVERRVVERRHETAGLLSGDHVWRYQVRTTIKNRYAAATTLTLLDLVPVSRDEAIKVKLLDGSTPATGEDPDRPGVRRWELKLGPKETRVVELRYEVRYPKDFPIQGLE